MRGKGIFPRPFYGEKEFSYRKGSGQLLVEVSPPSDAGFLKLTAFHKRIPPSGGRGAYAGVPCRAASRHHLPCWRAGRLTVRLPPNRIGTLTLPPLPATKNGGLAGRVFGEKHYKNRGFWSSTTLPAISRRGLGRDVGLEILGNNTPVCPSSPKSGRCPLDRWPRAWPTNATDGEKFGACQP
jgi:hypothetical protein